MPGIATRTNEYDDAGIQNLIKGVFPIDNFENSSRGENGEVIRINKRLTREKNTQSRSIANRVWPLLTQGNPDGTEWLPQTYQQYRMCKVFLVNEAVEMEEGKLEQLHHIGNHLRPQEESERQQRAR